MFCFLILSAALALLFVKEFLCCGGRWLHPEQEISRISAPNQAKSITYFWLRAAIMLTIEEAIDIAGQLHHFQDIVDDIRVFEEPMTNDDPFLTFTTKSGRLTGLVVYQE